PPPPPCPLPLHDALPISARAAATAALDAFQADARVARFKLYARTQEAEQARTGIAAARAALARLDQLAPDDRTRQSPAVAELLRSEEHTSELQSGGHLVC